MLIGRDGAATGRFAGERRLVAPPAAWAHASPGMRSRQAGGNGGRQAGRGGEAGPAGEGVGHLVEDPAGSAHAVVVGQAQEVAAANVTGLAAHRAGAGFQQARLRGPDPGGGGHQVERALDPARVELGIKVELEQPGGEPVVGRLRGADPREVRGETERHLRLRAARGQRARDQRARDQRARDQRARDQPVEKRAGVAAGRTLRRLDQLPDLECWRRLMTCPHQSLPRKSSCRTCSSE